MQANTLNLVGQIYDAVSEPAQWALFLNSLSMAMGAHAIRMRMLDKNHNSFGLVAATGHDSVFDKQYQKYYSKIDVLNPLLARQQPGEIIYSDRLVSRKTLLNSEIYNDLWRHYEVYYGLGINLAKTENYTARIGIHRARELGPFSESQSHLLQSLSPHLVRAFKLGTHFHELQAKADGMERALYHSRTPLLLIDENTKVVFVNQKAESILNTNHHLFMQHDRIRLALEAEQSLLQTLLQQAIATGLHKGSAAGGALRVTSASGEQRYNLVVSPYPACSVEQLGGNSYICAAVFIHDTREESSLPPGLLNTLYKLTPSETRLAGAILEGLTPAEAAERFGVSINTTRTQLRSLFAKTGSQSQADLVRLLSGLA